MNENNNSLHHLHMSDSPDSMVYKCVRCNRIEGTVSHVCLGFLSHVFLTLAKPALPISCETKAQIV